MSFTDFLILVIFSIMLDVLICGILAMVGIVGVFASLISFILLLFFNAEMLKVVQWMKAKFNEMKVTPKHAV